MEQILLQIFEDLKLGTTNPKHQYRYACLSSIKDNIPQQRMVVLREIENNCISIYTDIRTPKVSQLKENPNASVLVYDTKTMKQIHLTGKISIEQEYDSSIWNSISPRAKKDYTTLLPPGSKTKFHDNIIYNEEKINFCILKFTFSKIDFLQISKPNHIRIQFNLTNNFKWEGNYVIP